MMTGTEPLFLCIFSLTHGLRVQVTQVCKQTWTTCYASCRQDLKGSVDSMVFLRSVSYHFNPKGFYLAKNHRHQSCCLCSYPLFWRKKIALMSQIQFMFAINPIRNHCWTNMQPNKLSRGTHVSSRGVWSHGFAKAEIFLHEQPGHILQHRVELGLIVWQAYSLFLTPRPTIRSAPTLCSRVWRYSLWLP